MKLHKSYTDRIIMGVCGGIAETYGINSMVVRAGFFLLAVLTRSMFFWLYMLLAFMMPYGGRQDGGEREGRRKYKPEDPPFDISQAQDVEVERDEDNKWR